MDKWGWSPDGSAANRRDHPKVCVCVWGGGDGVGCCWCSISPGHHNLRCAVLECGSRV
jgi:hypothetical protein